jgi:hypothetical protein
MIIGMIKAHPTEDRMARQAIRIGLDASAPSADFERRWPEHGSLHQGVLVVVPSTTQEADPGGLGSLGGHKRTLLSSLTVP